ncbi:hypothetical protein JAAARDRAFT_140884 [Jaapia argillacea MUCL 33604]|uniref:Uncharacterized protein n=1 Tax=Jaapia argillacea MUCL 33604 TaxID=933084 RepID=A0A067P849_9AGAM|nr:hypothetical protein JAAARDRAFT_140884 [Jaapia argillacea MUCL 33604]
MGSAYSYINKESVVAVVVVISLIFVTYVQHSRDTAAVNGLDLLLPSKATPATTASGGKKNNKKKEKEKEKKPTPSPEPAQPIVVPFPAVIPGDFDSGSANDASATPEPESSSKAKKQKKKKATKKGTLSPPSGEPLSDSSAAGPSTGKHQQPLRPNDTDSSWTQVSRKKKAGDSEKDLGLNVPTSEVGGSTTGTSSPVNERTEDEVRSTREEKENRRTLAEKMLPKPRKTGVEDMLEIPDHPSVARVMRVSPQPGEKPASGFSWADYEDVHVDSTNDADGEDDGGWGVVKSRGRSKIERTSSSHSDSASQGPTKAPESLTKKQRQNAAKREAQKAAKAESAAEQAAALAKHKRELEKIRMGEKSVASVDGKGKLVWD